MCSSFSPISIEEGFVKIFVPYQVLDQNTQDWKYSLVGYFLGSRPTYQALILKARELWSLKQNFKVLSLPNGFILFKFEAEADKLQVLERGPWFFFVMVLILIHWDPNEQLVCSNFLTIPMWVRAHNFTLKVVVV